MRKRKRAVSECLLQCLCASVSQNLAYLKRLQWLGWLRLKGLANGWNDHGEEQAHRANADFVSTKVPGGFRRGDREKVGLEWGRPGAGWLGAGAGERGAEGAEDSRLHITTGSWCMASVNHRPSRELILTDEEGHKVCLGSLRPVFFFFFFFWRSADRRSALGARPGRAAKKTSSLGARHGEEEEEEGGRQW